MHAPNGDKSAAGLDGRLSDSSLLVLVMHLSKEDVLMAGVNARMKQRQSDRRRQFWGFRWRSLGYVSVMTALIVLSGRLPAWLPPSTYVVAVLSGVFLWELFDRMAALRETIEQLKQQIRTLENGRDSLG